MVKTSDEMKSLVEEFIKITNINYEDRKSTRSELQSHHDLVCRLLLEKKKKQTKQNKTNKKKKKKI